MLMLAPDDPEYLAIARLAEEIPRPDAIVVVSAHWIDKPIAINRGNQPATIHDFYGFPDPLYQLHYPAKGDSELAQRVAELFNQQELEFKLDDNHGLDHGAWAPLLMMYPDADIPVVQVSLPAGDLAQMVQLGEALSPLREQSILILASGGSVHNLRERDSGGKTADWALEFEDWLEQSITQNRFDDLITPARFPANFSRAHPTADHYVPLIVA
jgi:4,5-DOPA dioxygenase extradiol